MKKIISFFVNIFKHIASFIDRVIVIPITRLIIRINDFLKNHAKTLDKFASKKSIL